MFCHRAKNLGFSLLEVIIAVGVFAVAVSAMIGMLPSLTRQSAVSADTLNALRLPGALRLELERMAFVGGFDALAVQTKPLAIPLPDTCALVASRDASRVHALTYEPPLSADQLESDAQYFLIETWSFTEAPLAFETGGAVLPLHIRVSWPFHIPGSLAVTPLANRQQVDFNLSLHR
jgi:prepilin-type N-terminal cleavage/methylation domain-containing protein